MANQGAEMAKFGISFRDRGVNRATLRDLRKIFVETPDGFTIEGRILTDIIVFDPATTNKRIFWRQDTEDGVIVAAAGSLLQHAKHLIPEARSFVEKQKNHVKKSSKAKDSRENMPMFGFNATQISPWATYLHSLQQEGAHENTLLSFRIPQRAPVSTDDESVVGPSGRAFVKDLGALADSYYYDDIPEKPYLGDFHAVEMQDPNYKKPSVLQNSGLLGNHHLSAVTGLKKQSMLHRDGNNAKFIHEGPPEQHVNLTDNPNVGFVVLLPGENNTVRMLVVVQRLFATTWWYAGDMLHGAYHIDTLVRALQGATKVRHISSTSGNATYSTERYLAERVFLTYFTKRVFPEILACLQAHQRLDLMAAILDYRSIGREREEHEKLAELRRIDSHYVPESGSGSAHGLDNVGIKNKRDSQYQSPTYYEML